MQFSYYQWLEPSILGMAKIRTIQNRNCKPIQENIQKRFIASSFFVWNQMPIESPVELDLNMRWITSATWSFSTHHVWLPTGMMCSKYTKMNPNTGIRTFGETTTSTKIQILNISLPSIKNKLLYHNSSTVELLLIFCFQRAFQEWGHRFIVDYAIHSVRLQI